MTQQVVNVGSLPGDGTGDKGQVPFNKVNANFTELYNNVPYFGTDSGAANASVVAIVAPIPATFVLDVGTVVYFRPIAANTGPATLNVQGSGAIPIVNTLGAPLSGGEMQTTTVFSVDYNGTSWQVLVPSTPSLVNSLLTGATVGSNLYPATAAEKAAAITYGITLNTQYPYGNIVRYGADPTAVALSDAPMAAAIATNSEVLIPPGAFLSAAQVIVFPNTTIYGLGREGATWSYSGTSSAFKVINQTSGTASVPNSSGFGLNTFYGFTINLTNNSNNNACLEINACGLSYYNVHDMHFTGVGGKWALILDGVEVSRVYSNVIDACASLAGTTAVSASIWLTCGPDRTIGQRQGYTNNVTIQDNQINNAYYGILDDGGSCHNYIGNNINGAMIPARFSNVQGLVFCGHEIENVYATYYGVANLYFYDQTLSQAVTAPDTMPPSSAPYGAVKGASVFSNFFGANLAVGSQTINFQASAGTTYHTVDVFDNTFRSNLGVTATFNLTQAGGGRFWNNYDQASGSVQHYTGTHIDANGNDASEPAPGSTVGFTQAARIQGRTTFPNQIAGGAIIGTGGSTLTTKLKGTQAMAGTTVAVSFGVTLSGSVYQVSLCANLTGGPFWATSKSATGFTINAGSSFTGNVDWIVEQ